MDILPLSEGENKLQNEAKGNLMLIWSLKTLTSFFVRGSFLMPGNKAPQTRLCMAMLNYTQHWWTAEDEAVLSLSSILTSALLSNVLS